jgi:hypothetical protein
MAPIQQCSYAINMYGAVTIMTNEAFFCRDKGSNPTTKSNTTITILL